MTKLFELEDDSIDITPREPTPVAENKPLEVDLPKFTVDIPDYFTDKKKSVKYCIDKTAFDPLKKVVIQPKLFEVNYKKQLEDVLVTVDEKSVYKLFDFMELLFMIEKDLYPIQLYSSNYKYFIPRIVSVVNLFFKQNYNTLTSLKSYLSVV